MLADQPVTHIGRFAFASLPAASTVAIGTTADASDLGGAAGIRVISDGVTWTPLNGRAVLAHTTIPIIFPSSGTMGNNGALSGITSLNSITYAKAYIYLPASAISAGSAAGLYYVTMSSATAGTVFNNTYTAGVPAVPASPTAFSTTGPGAFTQTITTDIALISITIPANMLGVRGELWSTQHLTHANGASNKIHKVKFAATTASTNTYTTSAGTQSFAGVINQASQSVQVAMANGSTSGTGTVGNARGTVNFGSSQSITLTTQIATAATDWAVLERFTLEWIEQ